MPQHIKTECNDGVGWISLDRPDKRNALNREMLKQLRCSVAQLDATAELRVIVLQAVGSVFCAGMDLAQMKEHAANPDAEERWREDSRAYHDTLLALLDCRVPTIVFVSGPCIAGGVGLVLACDIVIVADSAFFALPEARRGIIAAMVAPLLLRRTSHARAGYALLSGRKISAQQALASGLCDEVVRSPEDDTAIQALLQSVLESSPQALATTKQFLNSIGNADTRDALKRAADVSASARASVDAREGLAAFFEKRKPIWTPQEDTS